MASCCGSTPQGGVTYNPEHFSPFPGQVREGVWRVGVGQGLRRFGKLLMKAAQPSLCLSLAGRHGLEGMVIQSHISTALASERYYGNTEGPGPMKGMVGKLQIASWWAGAVWGWERLQRVWKPQLEDDLLQGCQCPQGQHCNPKAGCTAAVARHLPCCLLAKKSYTCALPGWAQRAPLAANPGTAADMVYIRSSGSCCTVRLLFPLAVCGEHSCRSCAVCVPAGLCASQKGAPLLKQLCCVHPLSVR